jgi:uncharacterized protein (UPF0332 family)
MKEFEWYVRNQKVKRISPNTNECISLLKKAVARIAYVTKQEIDEDNAIFIFEDIYECMREAVQALMSLKGYKPYSHEATVAFLSKFYHDNFNENEIRAFDRFREMRNDIVYSSRYISEDEAKEALSFAVKFVEKIKAIP